MSNDLKQLDRQDRGWLPLAVPLRSVVKAAIVARAMAERMSRLDAEKMIRDLQLKDA